MFLGDEQASKAADAAALDDASIGDCNLWCDANFYIGGLRRMEDRQEEAISQLQSAKETCHRTSVEYWIAKEELRRLDEY